METDKLKNEILRNAYSLFHFGHSNYRNKW